MDQRDVNKMPDIDGDPTGFNNINHLRIATVNILNALTKSVEKDSSENSAFLIDGIDVRFIKGLEHIKIRVDHCSAEVIVYAPFKQNESKAKQEERREYYLNRFLGSLGELRRREITAIYNSLSDEGKKEILKEY